MRKALVPFNVSEKNAEGAPDTYELAGVEEEGAVQIAQGASHLDSTSFKVVAVETVSAQLPRRPTARVVEHWASG